MQTALDKLKAAADLATLPGVYTGVPMAEYLKLPALSAGVLKTIIAECPAAGAHTSFLNAEYVDEPNDASDAGTIAHSILLEGTEALCEVVDPVDYPGLTKPHNIPEGWTNKPIKDARDTIRERGLIPVLKADMALIRGMVASVRAYLELVRAAGHEPAIWPAFQPGGGDAELTCLWDDEGTLCRMRPDMISKDRCLIVDPKFSKRSAEPNSWARTQMVAMGYRISASFYRRGARALFGTNPDYVFLVCQQDPPHLCSMVGVDPVGLALGDAQVEAGMAEWREGIATGRWRGYATRVCYPEVQPWEQAGWLDRVEITTFADARKRFADGEKSALADRLYRRDE